MNLPDIPERRSEAEKVVEAMQKGDLSILSKSDLEYYNKVNYADDIMRDYNHYGKGLRAIAKMVMIKFPDVRSESTAYKLINDAKYIFRSTNILDKDYFKPIILDWQIKVFKLAMANPSKNFKHLNTALQNIIKILGFDKRDPDPITADMLGGNNYYMVLNFENKTKRLDLKSIPSISFEERLDIMKQIQENASEIEFEEILKADE